MRRRYHLLWTFVFYNVKNKFSEKFSKQCDYKSCFYLWSKADKQKKLKDLDEKVEILFKLRNPRTWFSQTEDHFRFKEFSLTPMYLYIRFDLIIFYEWTCIRIMYFIFGCNLTNIFSNFYNKLWRAKRFYKNTMNFWYL